MKAEHKASGEDEDFCKEERKSIPGFFSFYTSANDVWVMGRAVVFGVCYRGGRYRWAGSRGQISDVKINLKTDSRMPDPYKKRIIA